MSLKSHASTTALPAPAHVATAILVLALGGLFIGSGEFVSMSLLPGLAASTAVSIPAAGRYISAYALGVVIGAPLIAILAARWPRKALLLALIVLFSLGYAASALAWNHLALLVGRFLAGLPHGVYYGVACLVAADLAGAGRKAQAAGYVMAGLAAANVLGVPLATWIGQAYGWRATFAALAGSGLLLLPALHRFLPDLPRDPRASPGAELSGLKNPLIWLTLATASIGFGGMFAVYSYITPALTQVSGFSHEQVPLVLGFWGIGMIIGNLAGGWLADRGLIRALFLIMAWNTLCLALFYFLAPSRAGSLAALFLIGGGFALVPALQARLMSIAGSAQTLAAALNHSAFNISNALGASLGGLAIAQGFGWASTGLVGSLLALLGMVLLGVSVCVQRSREASARRTQGAPA
ncbi:MAG: Inner membrane transport protein YdhP [Stenotrophomonas maltophilia]|nr:MAG: Inner membrane transport protein YdhP [Stenotrophomonas maltophilia]